MGTLRIHFTGEDLIGVRLAPGPDPLWELVMSSYRLREPAPSPDLAAWRASARGELSYAQSGREGPACDGVRMLAELTRPGPFPDFLTPIEAAGGLEAGIAAVCATPREQLHEEIAHIGRHRTLPGWTRDLADGRPELVRSLGEGMRRYFDTVLRPHWPVVHAHIDADRGRRARAFLDGGCEQVLEGLRPFATWERPVLSTPYPSDREIHLGGRGLLLTPSYFCWAKPVTFIDDGKPTPMLVYPVEHDLALTLRHSSHDRLAALIGHTRSELLHVLADTELATGELARRLRVSPGNISQHTKVLREAGLIASGRHGNVVLHSASRLGKELLN
ncbi:ArsR/SmtB family transcription factor [Lentzea sp. NPDC051213]|uniref:ArsR/SmtB family transcription factor n=1 Tax=Lentzea sp. NPDC051213 TaxID=3364126 RepID=UPI0037BDD2DF